MFFTVIISVLVLFLLLNKLKQKHSTYFKPATPSTTKLSLVSVPVLSKQQISTFPANGIRNGSVQYTTAK